MKTITNYAIVLVCLTAAWISQGCVGAQTYGQRDYGQSGSNQPYDQPGYNNQPGYDQSYNQPGYDQSYNQSGFDQQYGQTPDFYQELNQYGQWVQTAQYGRVWIPNAGPNFQPYATNGHWVVTEYGNTWVSNYNWGWAPFHYGRWYQDPYRGWAWVPGNVWGPAWVSWRSGGGYYGWAPLGPGGNSYGNPNIPTPYWTFVPQGYITNRNVSNYSVSRPSVVNIYQQTTIINNVYQINNRSYAYGPRREDIERATRQQVPVYRVENAGRPGRVVVQDNTVNIYRPNVDAGRGTTSRGNGGYSDYSNRPDNNTGQPTYGNRPRGSSVQEDNSSPGTYNGGPRGGSSRENVPTPGAYNGQSRGNGSNGLPAPGSYGPRGRINSPDAIQPAPRPNPSYSGDRGWGRPYGQTTEPAQSAQPAPVNPQSEPEPQQRSFPQAEPREVTPPVQRSRGADVRGTGGDQPMYQPRQNSRPTVEDINAAPARARENAQPRSDQPAPAILQPKAADPAPTYQPRSGSRGPR